MRKIAMNLVICAFAVATTVIAYEDWELRGPAYESQKAADKYDQIWNRVNADKTTGQWYQNFNDHLMAQDMHPTMQSVGDTVPFDPFWGKRSKFIHSQGVVAPISFKMDPKNPYTGLFNSGSETAFIRFSIGAPCDPTQPAENNYGPNIGIKILRDGIPSVNVVVAPWDQKDWNYFSNDFSNIIPVAGDDLEKHFREATDYPQRMGVMEFALVDNTNKKSDPPVFPYQLIMTPTAQVNKLFKETYEAPFTEQLATLKAGTQIFDVYAVPEPKGEKALIGQIILKEDATTSAFGDSTMWFRHQDSQEDIDYKPDWKKYLELPPVKTSNNNSTDKSQVSGGCQYRRFKKAFADKKQEVQAFLNLQ